MHFLYFILFDLLCYNMKIMQPLVGVLGTRTNKRYSNIKLVSLSEKSLEKETLVTD